MLITNFSTIYNNAPKLNGYSYGKKITIPYTSIDSELNNFPCTIYLNNTNFDFTKIKQDGSDIRFTDANMNLLKFEKVEYSASSYSNDAEGILDLWNKTNVNVSHSTTYKHSGTYSLKFDSTSSLADARLSIPSFGKIQSGTIVEYWFLINARDSDDCMFKIGGYGVDFERENQSDAYFSTPAGTTISTGVNLINNVWYKCEMIFNDTDVIMRIYDASDVLLVERTGVFDSTVYSSWLNFTDADGGWIVYIDDISITGLKPQASYNVLLPTVSNIRDTIFYLWYGNSNAYNDSIEAYRDKTGKNFTYRGNVKLVSDIITSGKCAYFDGVDSYFMLPDSENWNFSNKDYCIETKFMYTALKGGTVHGIFSQRTSSSSNISMFLHYCDSTYTSSPNTLRFRASIDGTTQISIDYTIALELNTMYAITIERFNGIITMYLDGIAVGTYNIGTNTIFNSTSSFVIGVMNDTTLTHFLNGYLAGFRITKGRARYMTNHTPASNFDVDGDDVVFATDFDSIYDTNYMMIQHLNNDDLTDATGNGNNGVATGTTFVNTELGKARSFNGTSDYITIPNSTKLNFVKNFTLLSLFDANTEGVSYGLLTKYKDSSDKQYGLNASSTDVSLQYEYSGNNFETSYTWSSTTNQPLVATCIVDNSLLCKLYRDGILGSSTIAPNETTASTDTIYIGKWGGTYNSNFLNGKCYEIRASNIARSDAWIKAESLSLYNNLLIFSNV